jgi:hypothetical protein
MKTQLVGKVMAIPRGENLVDVFTGIGYENYSCFRIEESKFNGKLTFIPVSGQGVDDQEWKELKGLLR